MKHSWVCCKTRVRGRVVLLGKQDDGTRKNSMRLPTALSTSRMYTHATSCPCGTPKKDGGEKNEAFLTHMCVCLLASSPCWLLTCWCISPSRLFFSSLFAFARPINPIPKPFCSLWSAMQSILVLSISFAYHYICKNMNKLSGGSSKCCFDI